MNSLHDAVQSRNGPAEAAAYGERNGDVGLALLCRVGYAYGLRPPATRTVTDSDSGAGADELCNSTSRKNWDLFEEVTFIYYRN